MDVSVSPMKSVVGRPDCFQAECAREAATVGIAVRVPIVVCRW